MMKKKFAIAVMACVVTLGTTAFVAPNVSAEDATATPQVAKRAQGQSMVLNMQEVAAIFTQKYPDSAVHSISLQTDKGQFAYKVVGYTLKDTYTLSVDCITGKVIKEEKSGKEKDLAQKIFNPTKVISQQKAQAAAVAAIGEGAIAKSWIIEADKGIVTYEVDVVQGNKKSTVTLNAKDGSVMAKSAPVDFEQKN